MASITSLSIRRPVATTMLFLILIVVGFVSFRSLPVDLLPTVEFTQLTVRMRYANVGPAEMEQLITDPIENALSGVPNLERMTSRSAEGVSWVRLEFGRGTNIDEAANDLRAALDRLRDQLPVEAEPPEILKLDLDRIEVIGMAATSTHDLGTLTRILERDLTLRFKQIPGVGAIQTRGGIYREIRVDIDRDRLASTGLTVLDVRDAIGSENVTLPGGSVKSGFSDLYVRADGEYDSVEEIARTVVRSVNGLPIRVQDVATVSDAHEEVRYLVEINGVPSVGVGIQKQSGANTVEVARKIREEVDRINAERDDIQLSIFSDQSEFIQSSIDTVRNSALWGSFFAILVLYLFLRNRSSTAIIALSIPISIIATFGLLYFGGLTLNQMTFGGLALGVGLIVDNGIVVLESIVRKREEENASPFHAAEFGAKEVAGAITASTLTTCVIFVPVVFTRTTSGALFQALAIVVVFALACSLLVALTLVPVLGARYLEVRERREGGRFSRLEHWYERRIRYAIDHRGMIFGVTGALLALALLLWPLIPVELTPQIDANEIEIEVEMAQGTNIAVVREYVAELELLVRETLDPDDVQFFTVEVRGGDAEIELKLAPEAERSISSTDLAEKLRNAVTGTIPGAQVEVSARPGLWILRRIFSSSGGDDQIELALRGWDLEAADRLSAGIRERMERVEGVRDVRLSRREGQPEERITFDRERIAELGLSINDVARVIQANVGGLRAGEFREDGDEFPIVVRLAPEDRLTGQDLRNISLRTPEGRTVPLSAVVERGRGRSPLQIQRINGQRVTYITAELEEGATLGDAIEGIRAELAGFDLPPGFAISFGGAWEEQQKARRDFIIAIILALSLVYMLMAAQFERFIDPLIVMVSVPVALVGVVAVLLLTGTSLNLQSVMGLVMLIGIVVNNAIVLVDAINLLRRERNMPVNEAVIEAGRLRLRPILMTASTTALGLMPLAIGFGPGAEIQASLARVVIGGLLASTLVTLLLIPVTYTTVTGWTERIQESRRLRAERDSPRQQPAPA